MMCLEMVFKSFNKQWVNLQDNMFTKEQISKVLRRIQASIPKALMDKVVYKEPVTPTIKKVAELALNENIPEWKKDKLRTLLASGDLDKTVEAENPQVAQQIDNYVQREIKKAIKNKELPTKKQLKKIYEN